MKLSKKLVLLGACTPAIIWNGNRDLKDCWQDCERGDWMLYLMKEGEMCDIQTLTLAKARCAELAKPYMEATSLAALQGAFDFANGLISEEELNVLADAAYTIARTAQAAGQYRAVAAVAAGYYAAATRYSYATATATAKYFGADNGKTWLKVLKQCADICRETLPRPKIKGVRYSHFLNIFKNIIYAVFKLAL